MKRCVVCGLALILLLPVTSCRKAQQARGNVPKKTAQTTATAEQNLANAKKKVLLPLGNLKFLQNVTLQHPSESGNPADLSAFRVNEPIAANVDLKEVPPGLAVTAVFLDSNDSEMVRDRRVLEPAQKHVSFEVPDTRTWRPGKYHVQIWVGGDKEADVSFTMEPVKKKK